jgi:hypothetical protein
MTSAVIINQPALPVPIDTTFSTWLASPAPIYLKTVLRATQYTETVCYVKRDSTFLIIDVSLAPFIAFPAHQRPHATKLSAATIWKCLLTDPSVEESRHV